MRQSPEHSRRCEQAIRPTCVCSTCGSSNHGWSGHLARARRGAEGVRELREPAEQEWWKQRRRFQENRRTTPTKYLRQAGGGVAVAALVAWLADNRATVDRVEKLGRTLNRDVFDDKLKSFAGEQVGQNPDFADYGRALAGHFWCDLLAEIANVLDRGAELVGKIPDGVRDAVLDHEDAAEWGPVRTKLAEVALGFLWKSFQLLLGTDLKFAVLQLRILAVLICPDPGGHPRVARCCLKPLATETLRDHFHTGLDPEWLWDDRR